MQPKEAPWYRQVRNALINPLVSGIVLLPPPAPPPRAPAFLGITTTSPKLVDDCITYIIQRFWTVLLRSPCDSTSFILWGYKSWNKQRLYDRCFEMVDTFR